MAPRSNLREHFAMVPDSVLFDPRLTDGEAMTWLHLERKAGESGIAHASYAWITESRRFKTPKTAQRHVVTLLEYGHLELERAGAGHGPAWYRVINPARRVDSHVHKHVDIEVPDGTVAWTPVSPLLESTKGSGGGISRACISLDGDTMLLCECGDRATIRGGGVVDYCELCQPF